MRHGMILLAGLFAAATPVMAELEKGTLAPDIEAEQWINVDQPVSLKDYRGMVVVLFFWVSYHEGGESIMPLMNIVEYNWSLGRKRGIAVIGLTDADKNQVQESLEDTKTFFPVGCGSRSAEEYEVENYPHAVVLDPDGKVAWTGWPGNSDEFIKTLRDILTENPPRRTHPLEVPRVQRDLARARDELQVGDFRKAMHFAIEAYLRAVPGDPLKGEAARILDLVEAVAHDHLQAAEYVLHDKKYEQAAERLRDVMKQFRGTDSGLAAKETIQEMREKYPEFQDVLAEMEDESKAAKVLLEAVEAIRNRRLGDGYSQLEDTIEKYPNSEAAQYAREIRDRMTAREAVMTHVREKQAARECEMWLSQARSYQALRRYDDAKELLRKIINEYPKTSYADRASRELARLP